MPTLFSHAATGIAAGNLVPHKPSGRFWLCSILFPILPDADVFFMRWIPYDSLFGHRGFTHSLCFAIILGLAGIAICRKDIPLFRDNKLLLAVYFSLLTASHGVLDALTNGGLGVAFFSPFSNHRYFFPVRPIPVSPIGPWFFSLGGMKVLLFETVFIVLPCLGLTCLCRRRARRK